MQTLSVLYDNVFICCIHMVYMSELHKVFKSVKKRSAMIENNLIEQNGPNRKKYSMNIAVQLLKLVNQVCQNMLLDEKQYWIY